MKNNRRRLESAQLSRDLDMDGYHEVKLEKHTTLVKSNHNPLGSRVRFRLQIWVKRMEPSDSDSIEKTLTVPDSITTWTATAFVISENLGLGITDKPAELTAFQPFFLSLNLPAYIIRGEELVLEVILFNYTPRDLEVLVIVAQSDTFEFLFPDNNEIPMPSSRRVLVRSQSGTSVLIPIKALVLGEIPISVKAVSSVAATLYDGPYSSRCCEKIKQG
ncbi:CD109 antigen 150 kDa TGF-beta-1-binding protein [Larimichthys crocea]|uniref:CD109 antigen 150 kDa TGF-beta-1-binding protein n=1 Tax=Larimichthys crocea TaxID=215358 RepID=A0A6G0I5G4_LARCR|nr:CD109 antigen 150 kDa TGF-beta-1-binding protein [Larimichthys crocea]